MPKNGPIIIVDDDEDDRFLLKEILTSMTIRNEIIFFSNGQELIHHLLHVATQPFLILCDINMPRMSGLELRNIINENEQLRKKSIPFIFFSTSATREALNAAYDMTVQGFFLKGTNMEATTKKLAIIIDYWDECLHPNT